MRYHIQNLKDNHGAVTLGLQNTSKIERDSFVGHKQLKRPGASLQATFILNL